MCDVLPKVWIYISCLFPGSFPYCVFLSLIFYQQQMLLDAVEDPADVVVVRRAHRGILHRLLSDDKRFNWPGDFLRKAWAARPRASLCLPHALPPPGEQLVAREHTQIKKERE